MQRLLERLHRLCQRDCAPEANAVDDVPNGTLAGYDVFQALFVALTLKAMPLPWFISAEICDSAAIIDPSCEVFSEVRFLPMFCNMVASF